jgi:phosphomannomutase
MDLTDGVKVSLPHGWLHVRGSNTEPIIRISAEAGNELDARQITDSILGLVKEQIKS